MEKFKRYSGIFLLLLGVVVLVVYKWVMQTNTLLWGALALMVAGLIVYIVTNKEK